MTGLRERDWGISSSSLAQDLGVDPLDSTLKSGSWGQRVFVLPIRALTILTIRALAILTLRAKSESLA